MTESIYPKASALNASAVPASPSFPKLEEAVLDYWKNDGTFKASVDGRPAGDNGENEFVFYDGPPFANGLPHYGHLLTGYAKDLVARYQTQRGHKVERRFGWDTHGLPAELEAMKQLGMTDKKEILDMGIDNFNDAARASVLKYTNEWERYVTRQARWVDFENDYKTLNVEYMESVIWAFKQLHEKGLTYQGFRVLPYCWNDETPLSNHELRMDDDVYKDRQDQTVTVAFSINSDDSLAKDKAVAAALQGVEALAWTTTPWTLPTNQALAVGPEIEYVVVPGAGDKEGRSFLLAADLLAGYAKDLGYAGENPAEDAVAAVTARYTGSQLEGVRYTPIWDYFTDAEKWGTENSWQILVADYVSTSDGTGIVHQAPAYGEDDQKVCEGYGIPVVLSVDEGAKFLSLFAEPSPSGSTALAEIAGVQVFEANRTIINALKADSRLIREKSYVHSYPHCWRCRTPLIYRAITSWYVKVTEFKDRMSELNEQINWIPENVKHGQFGKWVENARDWSISRNRFWGSPIPVWVSDDPNYPRVDVYGSLEELKADFGRLPLNKEGQPDLHRPYIDELTRPNPDDPTGKSTMRRVEDVLDVWFDSGSMPYAQVHYPFENKEWFENHYPADFIVEYIGQTRGWFYTLHILATALFDRPAFKNVVSHGIVLGSDGQKMSKSLRNYPDVSEVLDRDGSDAMRWFLMSSPILRGGNLIVTEQGIREGVRQVMLPLWNVYHFFALYTNAANNGAGYEAKLRYDSQNVMDRFILGKTRELVAQVTEAMDSYDISTACDYLRIYADALTNWYVRRSRDRFFEEDHDAFDTLYTALVTVTKVAASLLPLTAEEMYRGLTGERSVHLADWPVVEDFADESELIALMETVREVCSTGSFLRKSTKMRVRQPLSLMTVAIAPEQYASLDAAFGEGGAEYFAQIVADELNLREVKLLSSEDADPAEYGISQQLKVIPREIGGRLGKQMQVVIKASKSGDWSVENDKVLVGLQAVEGGIELLPNEYELVTVVDENAEGAEHNAAAVLPGGFAVLNIALTEELIAEGITRDTIRAVQQARKDADLNVSDRIALRIVADAKTLEALRAHEQLLTGDTLATSLELVEGEPLEISVAVA
ncbi:MAG: isoleucine--tRNA ligase [Rothia sp. (in: high G+C Gram-positive bacteria)]|uniref:isoleucine--tRNA ligase n=1 Tax=Rothia sp. (in: high G+C Gram-positive bacteria) TaxID=1885016 RepID=UPI0026E06783|nr:isoleucine--tRNA ligase [Rothia sp. (in: high G+C Gram-positive bacteria)]MDO5750908.1 isoleucine--tRNA ligase [Rothia sp. (in: high G+C Gram-positive bacteria)]